MRMSHIKNERRMCLRSTGRTTILQVRADGTLNLESVSLFSFSFTFYFVCFYFIFNFYFNSFCLKEAANENTWLSAGTQWDNHNALSSDEEMFQDCDGFDTNGGGGESTFIAESENRTGSFSNVTFNNTGSFPSTLAHSTFSQSIGGDNEFSSMNNYMSAPYFNALNEAVNLDVTNFQSIEPEYLNESAGVAFNKTLENSAKEVRDEKEIAVENGEKKDSQEELEVPEAPKASEQVSEIVSEEAVKNPVEDNDITKQLEVKDNGEPGVSHAEGVESTDANSLPDVVQQASDSEPIQPIPTEEKIELAAVDQEAPPSADSVLPIESEIVDQNSVAETANAQESVVIQNDIITETATVKEEPAAVEEEPAAALNTTGIIESDITDQLPAIETAAEAVEPEPTVQEDVIDNQAEADVEMPSVLNTTGTIETDVTVKSAVGQTPVDDQLKSDSENLSVNTVDDAIETSASPNVGDTSSHSKPSEPSSPNATVIVQTEDVTANVGTPQNTETEISDKSATVTKQKTVSFAPDSTFDINSTRTVTADLASAHEIESVNTESSSSAEQSLQSYLDETVLAADSPTNNNDTDIFKAPLPPKALPFEASANSFGLTDDDFCSTGSKFSFILLLFPF